MSSPHCIWQKKSEKSAFSSKHFQFGPLYVLLFFTHKVILLEKGLRILTALMRRRISSNFLFARLTILVLASMIILITVIIYVNADADIDYRNITFAAVFLFFLAGIYYLTCLGVKVECDDEFMYIVNKKAEEKIQLKDIYKIKMNYGSDEWTVSYYNIDHTKRAVCFVPEMFFFYNKYFIKFQNRVKLLNREAKIYNTNFSFDPDE